MRFALGGRWRKECVAAGPGLFGKGQASPLILGNCGSVLSEADVCCAACRAQATGLREERRRVKGAARMGALLRAIEEHSRKSCDTDFGGWRGKRCCLLGCF